MFGGASLDLRDVTLEDPPVKVSTTAMFGGIEVTVPFETAFKFLQVTISRLDAADATVHAHLDPEALDDEAIETLGPLFDSVLERTDDEWTVHAEV